MPSNRTGSPFSLPNGDDALDLEVDRVPDADAVPQAVVVDLDLRSFDAEHLARQRGEARHRPAELPAEHLHELARLLLLLRTAGR
jgi:hypothetical protein